MRVSRVQAEENRQTVIKAAIRLFREHGFDGSNAHVEDSDKEETHLDGSITW